MLRAGHERTAENVKTPNTAIGSRRRNRSPLLHVYVIMKQVGPGRPPVRWIGILGMFAALVSGFAEAMDENGPCLDLLEENRAMDDLVTEQPLLTGNQCEAVKTRE